jgi:hypothetical protein
VEAPSWPQAPARVGARMMWMQPQVSWPVRSPVAQEPHRRQVPCRGQAPGYSGRAQTLLSPPATQLQRPNEWPPIGTRLSLVFVVSRPPRHGQGAITPPYGHLIRTAWIAGRRADATPDLLAKLGRNVVRIPALRQQSQSQEGFQDLALRRSRHRDQTNHAKPAKSKAAIAVSDSWKTRRMVGSLSQRPPST